MESNLDIHVILPLIEHVSLSRLALLSQTSKTMTSILNTREVLGTLKARYCQYDATSFSQLFNQYNKVHDLIEAIKDDDDVELVLLILKYRVRDDEELPSFLLPNILSLAAVLISRKVFLAICPAMKDEIDIITRQDDSLEYLGGYIKSVTLYVLLSNDATIYQSFFSMLESCNAGLEGLFYEGIDGPDNLEYAMYYSYSHILMNGDNSSYVSNTCTESAYDVMREYFDVEPEPNILFAYSHATLPIDFVAWMIESNEYNTDMLLEFADNNIHVRYLKGQISLDEAKKLEESRNQFAVMSAIRSTNELMPIYIPENECRNRYVQKRNYYYTHLIT